MLFNENKIKEYVFEDLNKSDLISFIKKDKEFEKKVKEIVTEVIVNLFKVLWQHKNFYETSINK